MFNCYYFDLCGFFVLAPLQAPASAVNQKARDVLFGMSSKDGKLYDKLGEHKVSIGMHRHSLSEKCLVLFMYVATNYQR